jgi:uncharacterized membrane protein YeaQ/YmgE (transglycosylase-associated protein family)
VRELDQEVLDMLIIAIILLGMLAGAAAQLIFPSGKRGIDWTVAIVVGLIGSFVGGLLASLLAGDGFELRPAGLIGSIVGAVVVTGVYRLVTGRNPGARGQQRH